MLVINKIVTLYFKGVTEEKKEVKKEKPKEEPSSLFQRQRVEILLNELLRKFPIPQVTPTDSKSDEEKTTNTNKDGQNANPESSTDGTESVNPQLTKIKQEPPEKRMKM